MRGRRREDGGRTLRRGCRNLSDKEVKEFQEEIDLIRQEKLNPTVRRSRWKQSR